MSKTEFLPTKEKRVKKAAGDGLLKNNTTQRRGTLQSLVASSCTTTVLLITMIAANSGWVKADCLCAGTGNCYEVTDETSFDNVPWTSLAAGDTVRVHHREAPYRRIVGLRSVGTASQPIKVCGVKSSSGSRPTITGVNATPVSGYLYDWGDGPGTNIGDFGVILIGRSRTAGDPWLHKAEHLTLEGLKITGAHASYSYTIPGEGARPFVYGAAGVRVTNGNNITIRDCEITDNGNGIFLRGDDNGGEGTITRNTLIEGNFIHHNGNVGRETEHNIYSQGVDPVFQYNRIGREREGALGSSLKDRSSGTLIRYNWIESNARTLDLVEAEDANTVVAEPTYGNAYVFGNILINEIDDNDNYASAANMVHFGADNMADDSNGACTGALGVCRNGTLYFYHNTVIIKDYREIAQGSNWVQDRIFEISIADATVDVRNNIFHLFAPHGFPNLTLMRNHGTANLNGTNWITHGWVEHVLVTDWSQWTGTVNYNGTLIEGDDPGLVMIAGQSGNLATDNYSPVETSPVLDQATVLAPQVLNAGYAVDQMYRLHQSWTPRSAGGSGMDLGALELGSGSGWENEQSKILKCYWPGILPAARMADH